MHITDLLNAYVPGCMDIPFAMPYLYPTDIKIYYNYNNEQISAITVTDCTTGNDTNIPLADWDYVIAENGKGEVYNYFTNPTLPEGLGCSFYFTIKTDGEEHSTEAYINATNCTQPRRCTTYIESVYTKYDCLNEKYTSARWYGLPVNVLAGDANLVFNNGMRIWGQFNILQAEFELNRFTGCIITKSEITRNYEITAGRIAPYFIRYVEAVAARGIIEIEGVNYELKSKSIFDKIRAFGVNQFDMNIELTDCVCTVDHDCDLDYQYTPPVDCGTTLDYNCGTYDYQGLMVTQKSAIGFIRGTALPSNDWVSFTMPDDASAISLFGMLTIGAGGGDGNGAPTAFHTFSCTDSGNNQFCFYLPYVGNITRVLNVVSFEYNFWFGAPNIDSIPLCGFAQCPYVETPILPIGVPIFLPPLAANFSMVQAWYDFTFNINITYNSVTWGTTAGNSLQLTDTTFRVYIPDGTTFTVTVDADTDDCGLISQTVTLDDNPA